MRGNLILTLHVGDSVRIGDCDVTLTHLGAVRVQIAVEAPKDVAIQRLPARRAS